MYKLPRPSSARYTGPLMTASVVTFCVAIATTRIRLLLTSAT